MSGQGRAAGKRKASGGGGGSGGKRGQGGAPTIVDEELEEEIAAEALLEASSRLCHIVRRVARRLGGEGDAEELEKMLWHLFGIWGTENVSDLRESAKAMAAAVKKTSGNRFAQLTHALEQALDELNMDTGGGGAGSSHTGSTPAAAIPPGQLPPLPQELQPTIPQPPPQSPPQPPPAPPPPPAPLPPAAQPPPPVQPTSTTNPRDATDEEERQLPSLSLSQVPSPSISQPSPAQPPAQPPAQLSSQPSPQLSSTTSPTTSDDDEDNVPLRDRRGRSRPSAAAAPSPPSPPPDPVQNGPARCSRPPKNTNVFEICCGCHKCGLKLALAVAADIELSKKMSEDAKRCAALLRDRKAGAEARKQEMARQKALAQHEAHARAAQGAQGAPEECPAIVASQQAMEQAVVQVMGMGFDEEQARAALGRTGWLVERAIAELCNGM